MGSTRHRTNRPAGDPNLCALVDAATPVTTIFGKGWLLHATEVLGATVDENLAMIADSVAFLRAAGRPSACLPWPSMWPGARTRTQLPPAA